MSSRKKPQSKYTFSLTGLNIHKIHQTYGIELPISGGDQPNTTKLSELDTTKGTPDVVSIMDETKYVHTCNVTMIDRDSQMACSSLPKHCYWCRNPFSSRSIGCPIRYVPSVVEKRYYSQISKDSYTIKQEITAQMKEDFMDLDNLSVQIMDYYETDGIFCSFNCCKAWIDDNKHNSRYALSSQLLNKMYSDYMKSEPVQINPASHWKLLKEYGGHLTIEKFRENMNRVEYHYHGTMVEFPKCVPVFELYKEQMIF